MIIDKETYLKIKNDKPNEEFLEECKKASKLFRKEELQQRLNDNIGKAVKLAEKNTIRNENGHVVITKDDEWLNDTEYDEENNSNETIDNKLNK